MTADAPVLSVLLPVRNEALNIVIMVKILEAVVDAPHEIIVVHDDPGDTTVPSVVELQKRFANLTLVQNNLGRGVANAIRAGVNAARGKHVLIFAADEVGPVLAISDMLALMDAGCDFVSCTRYAAGGRRLGGSLIGGILSRAANAAFGVLTKSVFTDATTGIKMFRKEVFAQLSLEARPVGWSVAFEMAIKAQLAGLRLGEVAIVSIDRLWGGKSTFVVGPWAKEYLRWFFYGVKKLHRFSAAPVPAVLRRSMVRA